MARRKRKKREEESAEVPLSAMIDVTFLLLTYFIMTQTEVIEEAYIQTNAVAPNPGAPPDVLPTTFDIEVRSKYYTIAGMDYRDIDGPFKFFVEDFARNVQGIEVTVNLKLSDKATAQRLVDLLDLLAKNGMEKKINIAYLKEGLAD